MSSQMPDFKFKATEEQIHELMMSVPAYQAVVQLQPRSKMRAFLVFFDNHKKRGMGKSVESHEAEGVVFSSGRVCIDTEHSVQRGYTSLGEMQEQLGKYGNVRIEWLKLEDA
jgi:hypothetical protein